MKFFVAVCLLAIVGSSMANRQICPHPAETGVEIADERIYVHAPVAGHSILELDLSTRFAGRKPACFTLTTESQNAGPHVVSLGQNTRGGFSVKIYTEERQGLQAQLQAYMPKDDAVSVA